MLHVVRSRSTIMGTGSFAFAFRRRQDARAVVDHLCTLAKENEKIRVWYTPICPDKFVMTTASPLAASDAPPFPIYSIQEVELHDFLGEMVDSNLSVRLIDQVAVHHEHYTLYSTHGYEPYHTSEAAAKLLERQYSHPAPEDN